MRAQCKSRRMACCKLAAAGSVWQFVRPGELEQRLADADVRMQSLLPPGACWSRWSRVARPRAGTLRLACARRPHSRELLLPVELENVGEGSGKPATFTNWLEDLFEKSDMKMENGNMGSESSKKLKCWQNSANSCSNRRAAGHREA